MDIQSHALRITVKENQTMKCELLNQSRLLDETLRYNHDAEKDLSATVTGNLKLVKQQNEMLMIKPVPVPVFNQIPTTPMNNRMPDTSSGQQQPGVIYSFPDPPTKETP